MSPSENFHLHWVEFEQLRRNAEREWVSLEVSSSSHHYRRLSTWSTADMVSDGGEDVNSQRCNEEVFQCLTTSTKWMEICFTVCISLFLAEFIPHHPSPGRATKHHSIMEQILRIIECESRRCRRNEIHYSERGRKSLKLPCKTLGSNVVDTLCSQPDTANW